MGWEEWYFGHVPFAEADVLVEDYKVIFSGPDGGNVEFEIDLTYSNKAYRSIINSKVTVERITDGITGGIFHIYFHENNRYTVTNTSGEYEGEGNYDFVPGLETFEQCATYTGKTRANGALRMGGLLVNTNYPKVPLYMTIYPDNSLSYGCKDDPKNMWKLVLTIEKLGR